MIDLERRGYLPEGGLLSHSGNFFYLSIPKNASSLTSAMLKDAGWDYSIYPTTNPLSTIVLLRDPLDRWISGVATYISSWVLGYGYGSDHFVKEYGEGIERLLFDNLIFDDHTEKQIRFVNQVSNAKVYFKVTKNKDKLVNDLSDFIGQNLNSNVFDNSAELNYDTKHITEFLKYRISVKPELADKIKAMYNEDYQLIEAVKFYGT